MVTLQLPAVLPLTVRAVQMSAMMATLAKTQNVGQNVRVTMQHTFVLLQTVSVKKLLAVKITQKLSYPKAHKLVESRTLSVAVSYYVYSESN